MEMSMYGDKWYGYLHANGMVTISLQQPTWMSPNWLARTTKIVGPFTEDLADYLEGDQKMVRRRILAAIYDKPLEEITDGP